LPRFPAGDTGKLRDTKTKAGRRFVPLRPAMVKELREWKLACPNGPLNLVNPNRDGGPMNHFNWRGRVFRRALNRAGLRAVRVHDLRHSCASNWLAAGVDLAAGHDGRLRALGAAAREQLPRREGGGVP
jgi:integrase